MACPRCGVKLVPDTNNMGWIKCPHCSYRREVSAIQYKCYEAKE